MVRLGSEGAPVPGALEALGKAADALVLGTLGRRWRLDGLDGSPPTSRAVAVVPARAQVLPLAKGAVAAVAGAVPATVGMEPRQLVKTHLAGRVLPAVDAAALAAVMAALEEAEGLLARRGGADRSGAVSLTRNVSAIGLERPPRAKKRPSGGQGRGWGLWRRRPAAHGRGDVDDVGRTAMGSRGGCVAMDRDASELGGAGSREGSDQGNASSALGPYHAGHAGHATYSRWRRCPSGLGNCLEKTKRSKNDVPANGCV